MEKHARVYEVEFDGGSALWQSPVPLKKTSLFIMTPLHEDQALRARGGQVTQELPKADEQEVAGGVVVLLDHRARSCA